jgi:hypothetical protein
MANVRDHGRQALRLRKAGTGYRRTVANEHIPLSHGRGRWFETSIAHSEITCRIRYPGTCRAI